VRFGWIRLHYLLLYAVVGAYMPYLPVFLGSDLHLPDWQIGWVTGIYGLSVLVAPPIVTSLADRSVSGRTIIGCAYVLACLGLIALALVDSFLAVLPLAFAFSLVYTPLFALLDGLAFSAIAAAERSPPYDRLRVWGSLGFMVPAFVLFFALHAGVASGRTAIVAAAVAAGLGALASPLLPNFPPAARASGLPPFAAWQALRGASTRALLIPVGLLFAAISVFYAFYGRLLISVGIDAAWIGLVMNIGVLAELPLMFAAGALLRRFSVRAILLTSAACLTARMALLATSDSARRRRHASPARPRRPRPLPAPADDPQPQGRAAPAQRCAGPVRHALLRPRPPRRLGPRRLRGRDRAPLGLRARRGARIRRPRVARHRLRRPRDRCRAAKEQPRTRLTSDADDSHNLLEHRPGDL
jgi:PPP family 3-phenylpropionic acid transporter